MEKMWEKAVRGLAACGGAIAGMLGGWDPLLRVLVTLMAADYITGLLVAVMGKSAKTEYGGLSSKVGAMGLARKGLMLMVVLVAALMAAAPCAATLPAGFTLPTRAFPFWKMWVWQERPIRQS